MPSTDLYDAIYRRRDVCAEFTGEAIPDVLTIGSISGGNSPKTSCHPPFA